MSFEDKLEQSFGAAAPDHFEWQTSCPFVSDRERELCRNAFLPLGERLLDIGCGEGATLVHLGSPPGAVGVDLFEDKLAFARDRVRGCRFVRASADQLPFEDGSFDHVIIRDVIHHIDDPRQTVAEVQRVLCPGGRADILEPCRYNPLIVLHALANPVERGELRSTMTYLTRLFAPRLRIVSTSTYQAFPIHRLVFHPSLGRPALATKPSVCRVVDTVEALASRLVPSGLWAYLHVRVLRD